MTTTNAATCPGCGKTGVAAVPTTIDGRTGKEAVGLGTLLFGIGLLAVAALTLVIVVVMWNDRMAPGRKYMYLPIVFLVGGGPIVYRYLREDRVRKMMYKCASCARVFEIGGPVPPVAAAEPAPASASDLSSLRQGLLSADPTVRHRCATAIGDLGAAGGDALPDLEKLRGDPSRHVSNRATWAIETIQEKLRKAHRS